MRENRRKSSGLELNNGIINGCDSKAGLNGYQSEDKPGSWGNKMVTRRDYEKT